MLQLSAAERERENWWMGGEWDGGGERDGGGEMDGGEEG